MKKENDNKKPRRTAIGGQALIEGVMMRGASSMAMAVRNQDGDILLETQRLKPKRKISRIPVARGLVSFISSLVLGISTLTRSAEALGDEDEQLGKGAMALTVIIALVLALGIFFFLPGFLAGLFETYVLAKNISSPGAVALLKNLFSGILRITIFVGYLALVSLLKDIRRTFMYHGAEHKTINCFEKGLPLDLKNVRTCSTRHNRCGTTFLFLVMVVSIIVFAFAELGLSLWIPMKQGIPRNLAFMGIKLLLLPLVAGISYEVLFAFARMPDNWFSKALRAPGLALQKLSTKEPDDGMLEVAITSFKAVCEMDADSNVKECKFGQIPIDAVKAKAEESLRELNAEPVEAVWMLCYVFDCKRSELASRKFLTPAENKRLKALLDKRKELPLDYCLGVSSFYGRDIKVDRRVLIPRMETEILAEAAIKTVESRILESGTGEGTVQHNGMQSGEAEVLDLCTGSGCIALTICRETCAKVTAADISMEALEVARINLEGTGAELVQSDLFSSLSGRVFDVIVCNPPYVKSGEIGSLQPEVRCQPRLALDGGGDGLDFYRRLVPVCAGYLKQGGVLLLETGHDQAETVKKLLLSVGGFASVEVIKDLSGIDRVVKAFL